MKYKIIACVDADLGIGNNNELLYHIHDDMVNFRSITMYNGVVIMGRKTFESLPNHAPLAGRINIILTRDKDYNVDSIYDDVYIVHTINECNELCDSLFQDKECFVIGGESIYQQFLLNDLVDTMFITHVNAKNQADSHFPNVFENWWVYMKSSNQSCMVAKTNTSSENILTYRFVIYKKKLS